MARQIGGYLKPGTAAQYLGIPLEEVRSMLEQGELPGVVINGQWRVPIDQLERWLDEEVSSEELKKLARHLEGVGSQEVESFVQEASREGSDEEGEQQQGEGNG